MRLFSCIGGERQNVVVRASGRRELSLGRKKQRDVISDSFQKAPVT